MKNEIITLTMMVIFLASATFVNAIEESVNYCINDTHKFWEKNIYYNNDLDTWNDTVNCTYGCDKGQCLPRPNDSNNIAFIAGLGLISFFFMIFAFKFDLKHVPLQIFFIFMSLYFIFLTTAALGDIAETTDSDLAISISNSAHLISSIVIWVIAIYLVIWLIYELLVRFGRMERIQFNLVGG